MKSVLHNRWISFAALAIYVGLNVGAAALHHHHHEATEHEPAGVAVLQIQPPGDSDDGEDTCLLCNVLHLAQTPPALTQVEIATAAAGQPIPATPLIRPYPVAT